MKSSETPIDPIWESYQVIPVAAFLLPFVQARIMI